MSSTAQQLYNEVIQALSPAERLRLATLILNGLVQQSQPVSQSDEIDQQDSWTEQDQADIANFSLQYAASLGSDDEAV